MASTASKTDTIWGLGRRKTSVARVYLRPGTGVITVNKRPMEEFFTIDRRRKQVRAALELVGAADRYDVFVNVKGGGETGQADAILMGVSRALLKVEPDAQPELRRNGMLTRDSRMVERKKYGLRKARRGCQFSKR
ncbi:MAG: 30S ribosomal protein S9 [Planctomycetota bacterium]|nr:MAG: 30S ribosomal protein S9 [Planctomycetota bacterium]